MFQFLPLGSTKFYFPPAGNFLVYMFINVEINRIRKLDLFVLIVGNHTVEKMKIGFSTVCVNHRSDKDFISPCNTSIQGF